MPAGYKETERCTDSKGNSWEINYVRYERAGGEYDEVAQVKKNGYEVGHITWHYDRHGVLKQRNDHGSVDVPCRPR